MKMKWLVRILKGVAIAAVLGVIGVVLSTGTFYSAPSEKVAKLAPVASEGRVVLVAGATSASGVELVRVLKERGWRVVAMVRKSSNTAAIDALGIEMVVADAMRAEDLPAAFAAAKFDAVVSLIGTSARDLPQRRNPIDVRIRGPEKMNPDSRPDYVGNRNLIDATRAADVSRFVLVTVIGAGDSHAAVPIGARRGHEEVIALKTRAEDYLRASGLQWTIIRPGGLGRQPPGSTALLVEDPRAFSYIARSDLGRLTADALGDSSTIGRTYTAFDPARRMLWRLFSKT
jgi:uncharacterized protein YbjT (DUF2867 family)